MGDSVELLCQVSKGDKPIQISWNFHGQSDITGLKIKTKRLSDKSSLLSIPSAKGHHTGRYTCTATNLVGSNSYSINLLINGIFHFIIKYMLMFFLYHIISYAYLAK